MIRKVRVKDLEVGDRILWADDYTRKHMCATECHGESNWSKTQVLKVLEISERTITYATHGGERHSLWYTDKCVVYVFPKGVNDRRSEINYDAPCGRCGKMAGVHKRHTWRCPDHDVLGFLPKDESFIKGADFDFFAELGL